MFTTLLLTLATAQLTSRPVLGTPTATPQLGNLAHGDFVALIRFVGHDEAASPRVVSDVRHLDAPMVALSADRYRVVASNQIDAPERIKLLRLRRSSKGSVRLLNPRSFPSYPDGETYLVIGHRATDGVLRGSDFGEGSAWGGESSRLRADPDEVAPWSVEPTHASRLAVGRSPEEIYLETRLLSLESPGNALGATGDAAFLARAVRELSMVRPQGADNTYGKGYLAPGVRAFPELAKRIRTTIEGRYPEATSVDERLLLATTLVETGDPNGLRLLDRALERAVDQNEIPSGIAAPVLDAVPHEAAASDRAFSLAARTQNGFLRAALRRRADALPTTESGWSGLMRLVQESEGEELHELLRFMADRTRRADLQPPDLTDVDLESGMARLKLFWRTKRLTDLRLITPSQPKKSLGG